MCILVVAGPMPGARCRPGWVRGGDSRYVQVPERPSIVCLKVAMEFFCCEWWRYQINVYRCDFGVQLLRK